jgi:hypothetical protein
MARGALAGGLALVCATTAYYGVDLLFDGDTWWGGVTRYWLVASVLFGPPLGVVGALIRRSGAAGTVAALVVPAGAALQMVFLPPPADSRMAEPVRLSIWIAVAFAIGLIARGNGGRGVGRTDLTPIRSADHADRLYGVDGVTPRENAEGG